METFGKVAVLASGVQHASFDASLVDLETLKIAWMASARTGGSEYADGKEIVASFDEGTADALESKQLLAQRPRRNP